MTSSTHSLRTVQATSLTQVAPVSVLDDVTIGRIEEWVVSTLDDRKKPAADTEWMNSLDGLTLTKRAPKLRENSTNVPASPGSWARFRLSRRRGVAIVSLTDQSLVKEEDLEELTGDLLALVEAGHQRIVLDFFAVERLSSWAARAIDQAARLGSKSEGSAVKFSGLRPEVSAIFAMTGLDPSIAIYPDTASAVAGVWPDLPVLRPLPVSILTALMRAQDARQASFHLARSQTARRGLDAGSSERTDEDDPPMTGARLITLDGPSMGRSVEIRGAKFLIGRGPECRLLIASATVSRAHASIERRGNRLFLRDLKSTNGTILNGRTLRGRESELRDGDRIQVGKLSFALELGQVSERSVRSEDLIDSLFQSHDLPTMTDESFPEATEEYPNLDALGEETGLKYEIMEGILVVTPLASQLDEVADVNAFRDALVSLAAKKLPKRVVVNLTHLSHLSGQGIGVLVAHHLRLDRSGGALRVCLANPRVAVVLEQIKLGMLVDYHHTVEEAVIAAWPEPAALSSRA